jgi:hypothetical protein
VKAAGRAPLERSSDDASDERSGSRFVNKGGKACL